MLKKILALALSATMLMGMGTTALAYSDSISTKDLLMIVPNNAEYDLEIINADPEISLDIVEINNITDYNLNDYYEISIPFSHSEPLSSTIVEQYNQGKKIYLYGELTINDFSNVLSLETYGVDVPLDVTGVEAKNVDKQEVFMFFGDDFSSSAKHNVVALQKDSSDGLLASVPMNEYGEYSLSLLMKAVVDDVSPNRTSSRATTVDYDFSVKTYDYLGHYAILDWFLYKQDESISEYDYFAVKTNLGLEGNYFVGTQMNIDMDLPFSSDEYIESGPGDSSESSSFDVSLGFGPDVSGSVGWSFSIDNDPEIDRTASLANNYAHWTVEENWYSLDGEVFSPGMTWASTGTYAGIDISFRGYFFNGQLSEGQWTDWKTIEVRYSY